jgi:outer membrane autotransporter protein
VSVQERLGGARDTTPGMPEGGGASADEHDLGGGFSVFLSAGATALDHDENKFELGYDAAVPQVTAGFDYRFNRWLVAGLAFNYYNASGDYNGGGRFNTDSYGGIAFASIQPVDNAFADITLGYAYNDYYRTRRAFIKNTSVSTPTQTARGGTDGDQLSTTLLLGYDIPIDNITFGPRAGISYSREWVSNYRENGTSGLALRYSGMDDETLQTSLGGAASMAISTSYGVVVPQLSAQWVHDYAIGGRNVNARYVDDPTGSEFKFKREQTARNFAIVDVGISASLPHDIQPFANFTTMQGNTNFTSYGGVLGVRIGFGS